MLGRHRNGPEVYIQSYGKSRSAQAYRSYEAGYEQGLAVAGSNAFGHTLMIQCLWLVAIPMPSISIESFIALLSVWGYAVLLPLAIIEGPIVGVFAGFFVSLGQMSWYGAFAVLFVGDIVGDVIYYYIGRWGHGPWANRIAARFGVTPERLAELEESFHRHSTKILLINKTQAIGSVVLYYAGAVRMPLWRFVWVNAVGTVPKVILFMVVGYYFGESYRLIDRLLSYAGLATLAIPLVLVAGFLAFRRWGRLEQEKEHVV
jgi:membrane protein DedA with SNARE-associated domain